MEKLPITEIFPPITEFFNVLEVQTTEVEEVLRYGSGRIVGNL